MILKRFLVFIFLVSIFSLCEVAFAGGDIGDNFCESSCKSVGSIPECCDGKTLLCPPKYRERLACDPYPGNPDKILSRCVSTSDGHTQYALPACINSRFCISDKCSSVCDSSVAYFEVYTTTWPHTFIIKLNDKKKIEEARRILTGNNERKVHVRGKVVKEPAPYNSPWSYHLDPETIDFFEFAVEVCDGYFAYVEEYLDLAGGSFLPGLIFCPWGSQILREVTCGCGCDRISVPPILRSINPSVGKIGNSVKITVTGIKPEDLYNSNVKVYFGSTIAPINGAMSHSNGRDTELDVFIPKGTGRTDVTITNFNGQRSVNSLRFTYQK